MANSRTKNSTLSIITSCIRQVLTIILAFASRTVFIYTLGAQYLGLNGLFTNILSILALSELGIGSAIAFYLYKPLADRDIERIKVLMNFYRRCYNYVGFAILILGCSVVPFLKSLVNLENGVPENLYLIYLLFLLQNSCTYFFFAYKQTLVSANQELYKIEKYNIAFTFINCLCDIVVLIAFRNFILYLISKLILVIIKNLLISYKIDKEYSYIKEYCSERLSKSEIRQFFKDLYSISIFKVGSTLFNTLSNLMISIMIGTVVVGYYSNYFMITSQVSAIYILIITAISAGVGNVVAKESKEKQIRIYNKLSVIIFFIYALFSICLFQLLNSFINIWLGKVQSNYVLNQWVVLFLCLNFYIDSSCQLDYTFRNAGGYFKIGQYLQIIGGIINVCFAIPLCKYYGLTGVFAAQVFSKLITTYLPFIINVQKTMFGFSKKNICILWLKRFSTTVFTSAFIWFICVPIHKTTLINFIIEFMVTITITCIILFILFRRNHDINGISELTKEKMHFFFSTLRSKKMHD